MRSAETFADRVALAVLAGFTLVALLTFRDYGLGWDDYTHSQYGDLLLALYRSGFADTRAFEFVNLYMYGGGFDMAAALTAKILPLTLFEARRLAGALTGLAGFALVWRTGRRLGGPLAGSAALVLLIVTPHFYGHIFINAKDTPFAVAALALLYGFVRALDEFPKPATRTVVIFGIALGFAFGTRILAVVIAIPFVVAVLFLFASDARRERAGAGAAWRNFRQFFLRLLPAAPLGVAIMGLLWPWSMRDPLNAFRAVDYFRHFFEKPWDELFAGKLIPVPDMPASYVPWMFALKLPEGLLLLALAGAALALWQAINTSQSREFRAKRLVVLLAAVLPIMIAVVTRPAGYNGIRHFLFAVPPLALLAGLAAARLIDWARAQTRPASFAIALMFAAAATDPLAAMIRLHPLQYSFYNHLAGGVAGARGNYMVDYWGLSFKQASEALRAWLAETRESPPPGRPWKVAACGPHPPARIALGDGFELTWDPKGADFVLMLGEFYCARLDAPLIATVERAGLAYAHVYDIRGRDVRDILTRPPP